MLWSVLKWTLPAIALLAVAGALFTRKTFHVETVIAASPEEIWAVLVDTSAYPEWNPVFVEVDGTYALGATVENNVRDPDGKILAMTAEVRAFAPGRELRQYGGVPGVITFDHRWLLEPAAGGTRVVQHEVDRGIYLWFWDAAWIEPAYARVLDALAARVTGATDPQL